MEDWMNELGLVMNISELGVNEEMIDDIAESTINLTVDIKSYNIDILSVFLKVLV